MNHVRSLRFQNEFIKNSVHSFLLGLHFSITQKHDHRHLGAIGTTESHSPVTTPQLHEVTPSPEVWAFGVDADAYHVLTPAQELRDEHSVPVCRLAFDWSKNTHEYRVPKRQEKHFCDGWVSSM